MTDPKASSEGITIHFGCPREAQLFADAGRSENDYPDYDAMEEDSGKVQTDHKHFYKFDSNDPDFDECPF